MKGNLILPQQELIRQAALDGVGIAFLFEETVTADIRAARLIAVKRDWGPPFDGFYIYYPSRRQMRPALAPSSNSSAGETDCGIGHPAPITFRERRGRNNP